MPLENLDPKKMHSPLSTVTNGNNNVFEEFEKEPEIPFLPGRKQGQGQDKHLESAVLEFGIELEPAAHLIDSRKQQNAKIPLEKTGCRRFAGITYALLAGICYTVATLIVKALPTYHPVCLSVWRYLGIFLLSTLLCLYYIYVKKFAIFSGVWPLTGGADGAAKRKVFVFFLVNSVVGSMVFILRFYSLLYLTLADATVIAFSGPIFTVVLGHFCLGEKCGIVTIPIALWTLFGVCVTARPPFLTGETEFNDSTLIGIGIGLASVIFLAIAFILARKTRKVHLSLILFQSGATGTVLSVIIAYGMGVFKIPEGGRDILMISVLAILSFMGNMCVTSALKHEQAGTVGLVRTSDVLFAFVWQIAFLDIIPDIFSYLGALIVVSGVLLTAFRKWVSTLPEKNVTRRMFGFLLK